MRYEVAVIESVSGEAPGALVSAFRRLESTVRVLTVDELQTSVDSPRADVLAVSARVPASELNSILVRFGQDDPAPVVIVFAETEFGYLEQHVRQGRDYIVPPFLPELVGARMHSCYERERFSQSMAESEARARLVSADRDMEIAREIQVGFLPQALPQPAGWELASGFQPARKVSGDFYDAFTVANGRRTAFIVADVCDKGIGAALFMALIRSLLRHTAEFSGLQSLAAEQVLVPPDDSAPALGMVPVVGATPMMNAIRSTNGYLTRNHAEQGYFATLFFGVLDPATGRVAYINCGHNPPVLLRADGRAPESLGLTGPAVGVIPDCLYTIAHVRLDPRDTLLVYTDGVTEARARTGEFFGEERLMRVASRPGLSGKAVLQALERALDAHVGDADQFDDITMMTIHRLARQPAPGIAE